jgi:hypothetical protein
MLDKLTAWLTPAQRKVTYAAIGAVASLIVVLGYADQASVDGYVALASAGLGLLALVVAAIKAKSVDWKALYVTAAVVVTGVKSVGLIDDQLESQTNKVLGAAVVAIPLIIAAVRTDTSVATGQPAQELAADLAQQQVASPPLPAPEAPPVDPDAYDPRHDVERGEFDTGIIVLIAACVVIVAGILYIASVL